jgi:hypothetical protein
MLLTLNRGQTTLLAAVFGAFLLVGCGTHPGRRSGPGGVARTPAGDRDHACRERIQKAEAKLRREIDRHGEHSRQAQKRRYELDRELERCGRGRDRDRDRDNR